ncbi:MAG: hypothetical protein H7834_11875 [Magnetococcus sp. YQC-9]
MNTPADSPEDHPVSAYHNHSKHHAHRYAPGPGHLDWANQPDPFRSYAGAPLVPLPLVADTLTAPFSSLYAPAVQLPVTPLSCTSIAALLELSLGLSAWKVHGDSRWALRCNPSSGNLHPTEGYLITPDIPSQAHPGGISAGVYHYVSRDHRLEQRRCLVEPERTAWNRLFPPDTLLIGLSSIHWRETWKYGDRAFRYCQLDIGHALGAFRYAASLLGWRTRLLTAPATHDVARLLGTLSRGVGFDPAKGSQPEAEEADLLLTIERNDALWQPMGTVVASLADLAASGPWFGQPNRLSRQHGMHWPWVDRMAEATRQPQLSDSPPDLPPPLPPLTALDNDPPASRLIRQRRSAQRFDPAATLPQTALWRILDALLPRPERPPWDALPWAARIFPIFMLHRVEDLEAGLYILIRDSGRLEALQAALGESLAWSPVPEAPAHLPFYRLQVAALRESAYWLSCQQEIASNGVLTLGMVGDFPEALSSAPWLYRQLYWEAGMMGQTLYLEAESAGMRGTGIGCFLDDLFHQLIGLRSARFQSLYHFTLGRAIVDERLRTEAPYAFLAEAGKTLRVG